MSSQPVEDILEESYRKFTHIPPDLHLLCPKVDEDDFEDYDDLNTAGESITALEKKERVEQWKERLDIAYWTSLLLAYGKDKAGIWLEQWGTRMAINLHNCDKCVLNWHMHRKKYIQVFSEKWPEDAVAGIENCLHRFDFDRIDKGLQWAKDIIEKVEGEGRLFQRADLGEDQGAVLLTVYEALCCMAYLSLPDKRNLFQFVFVRLSGKKPLKLGENVLLPAMTQFLFGEDKTRLQFAEKSWERLRPKSLTEAQFSWAVHDNLVEAIQSVAQRNPRNPADLPEIERFWKAVNWIIKTLDEKLLLHGLRSMEVKPSLYDLLFVHMQCESEAILLLIIQALTVLLETSPQAFWDTIGDARPFVVIEQLLSQRLFKQLLAQSLTFAITYDDGSGSNDSVESITTSWINTWIQSLKRQQKSDACEQLLHLLFEQVVHDASIGEQGRAACIRAGLDALDHVLRSFLDPSVNTVSSTTSVYINSILNVTFKYKDIINDAADTKSQEQHTLGVPKAAMSVISAAMSLDSRATSEEHLELRKNENAAIQTAVTRRSADLWDGFLENLFAGKLLLAKTMLMAMAPLINVERFRGPRKEPDNLTPAKKSFNNHFIKVAEALGRVLQRMCEFTSPQLNELCLMGQSIRPIIAFTVHGEDEISSASAELIKSITEQPSKSEAITALLDRHLSTTLSSMIFATRRIMEPSSVAWGPARHIITTAKDVLKSLSDLSSGILRSKTLENGEQIAVTGWWVAHWRYIEVAFQCTATWSHQAEINVMQDFCRDVIELADGMLAQDGLFASALQATNVQAQPQDLSKMQQLLKDPQRHLTGIVRMLRLRDLYLVEVTVKVVAKLLMRLRENQLDIPDEPKAFVQDSCVKSSTTGKYPISTNLSDQQRAELLKALGEDDDVEIIQIQPVSKTEKPKKQSLIDAWSKSGSSTSTTQINRSNKDDVLELSSSVDKKRSILEQMAARQKASSLPSVSKLPPPKPRLEPVVSQASKNALIESRKKAKLERAKRDADMVKKAQALRDAANIGEGSGLKGLSGVVGKDLAPQKSQILVDSDEEEEDDSEDEDLNNLISKGQQGQKAVDEATRRRERALLEKTRGPVKKVKVQRSAKDMRARLIPPMDQLHQAILEWDIFHEGNDPPSTSASLAITRVASTYAHPQEYKQTFLGLLISEAWRSFVTAKDETTSKPYGLKIASRMNVDKFLEVTASIPSAESKERMLSEGDIILVSKGNSPLTDNSEAHALARIWKTTYKKERLEVTYRLNSKNNPLLAINALGVGSELQAVKITNMTTIEREYAALESLQYYDLMLEVLKAEPSPILKYGEEAVNGVMQNYQLNPGQAKAILGAKDNDGFTLIQGPPGTGKTKTIVAMVGSLLTGNITTPGTAIKPKLVGQAGQNAMPKKLLVCAPSNAAVDELVLRLKKGVKTMTGSFHKINVLRLGRSDAINAAVRDVTLDELVKKKLEGDTTQNKAKEERDKMHNDAAKIRDELAEIRPKLDEARAAGDRNLSQALQRSFDQLKRAQINIGAKIDEDKASGNTVSREAEIRRRQIQQEILDGAQVLCATLSGSGHEMFKNLNVEFETVIIDEAAQCVELSALIPLKYGCTKCILVGDPKQLPPTVLSQSAARFGYDQSLFVRMQQNHPDYVHLLDRQYRMHPEISLFPSMEFYEGKLVDGEDMSALRRQPWHASALLGPYRFFDVEGTQSKGSKGRSLVNHAELRVAIQLYERFKADFGRNYDVRGKIGIITPYKAQLQELKWQFSRQFGEAITDDIEFNTTDAFQGRECEIIIFSCVRADPTGGIGFVKDIRRMNVGLTRAKSSLWILGDSRALVQGEFWNKLIDNAKQRSLYTKGDVLSMLRKPSAMKALPPPSKPVSHDDFDSKRVEQSWVKEIDMTDASTAQPQKAIQPPQQLPTNYTAAEHRPGSWESNNRIERINERGEVRPAVARSSDRPPIIQSSTPKQDSKKRPSDANDGQRGSKRMATEQDRSSSRLPPTGPKSMGNASKEPKKAKDPSAMVALGLTPAARPPATGTASGSRTSSASSSLQQNHNLPPRPPGQNGQNGPVIHRKKPKADPFIQRKPPRR
ncbi:helicase Sen1 [Colletotrichum tofieldiae]|uniref:Helicase Sen1 n=1 Tax=Colletotrichum tofieldiae TaxID=708197 RepID=A0A166PZS5_9PEZI|nr:helicase Sen1 [Colletotrichum tofieldiae]GKT62479.1 helicase Sen1 [Colletotrichum tofieldiae]GKT69475.1 helicase Sen1 [Colletotrichum tofieldiae]